MSFGQQLRVYRRQGHDPLRGGLLTQERLGELMGREMGDAGYSGAAVSDWERDKSKIHADDRRALVAMLTVLVRCQGLVALEDANELLAEGNYRQLNQEEIRLVFPGVQTEDAVARLEKGIDAQVSVAPAQGRDRAQRVLLEKVERFWVAGVLQKSIAGAPRLALKLCVVGDAVDHPWEESLGPAWISEDCEVGEDVLSLFERSERALLILGAPGSGKTISLIRLAEGLLEQAKKDSQAPMPVILDLAGWAKERRDFADWIVEELTAKYQIPRRHGRRWLAEDELVLLLDGFDILPQQARGACVRAVNRFRETNGLSGLAICSRRREYLECGRRLRFNQAVEIMALTEEQVEDYLAGSDLAGLRRLVGEDVHLGQMVRSPLMLGVMAAVSDDGGRGAKSLRPNARANQHTDWSEYKIVFAAYEEHMFERQPSSAPYSQERTLGYLRWLARRLQEHSLSIFMIEGMQPSWLPSKHWRWLYMLLSGLILGLAGGLMMWLLWRLLRHTLPELPAAVSSAISSWFNLAPEPVELLTIMIGNVALGLLTGVILGIFFEARRKSPVQAARIGSARWQQVWTVGSICGLAATLFVAQFTGWYLALAWGVAEGFMYMAASRFLFGWSYESDVRTVEALGWSWRRALTGCGVGVILTLVAEVLETLLYGYNGAERTLLTLMLAGLILGGLTGSSTTEKSRPNQGVWLSLRNAGLAAVFVALPLALVTSIMRDWRYGLIIGVLSALIAAALFGAGVFVKHFLLRGLLRLNKSLPWRYSRFLNYAAQLVFLRKVGGGYIFMHRLLQEYFVGG